MTREEIEKVVLKLIGNVTAVADSSIDSARMDNLNNMIYLTESLIEKIIEASEHSDSQYYSKKRIGVSAEEYLNELTGNLTDFFNSKGAM